MKTECGIFVLAADKMDRELISEELKKQCPDCVVHLASKVGDFKKGVCEERSSLFLLMLSEQKFDGLKLVKYLSKKCTEIPVIVIAEKFTDSDVEKYRSAGIRDFILKAHISRLGFTVKNMLALLDERNKRNEIIEELEKSEKIYRTLFENTGAATMVVEPDMTISLANRESEKITGMSVSEMQGTTCWRDMVMEEDRVKMEEMHRLRLREPDSVPEGYEIRFRDRDGNIRHALLSASIIPGTDRSIVSLIDVTKQKKSQEALLQVEERYKILASNIPNGAVLLFDRNLRITFLEGAGLQRLGLSKNRIEGRMITDVFTDEDPENLQSLLEKAIGGKPARAEVLHHNLICEFRAVPLQDDEGQVYAGLVLLQDVTERESMLNSLKESQETYRKLLESSKDAILLEDLEGDILDCNDAALRMYGYTRDELLHRKVLDLVPKEIAKELNEIVNRQVEEGGILLEAVNVKKNGQQFPVEVHTKLIESKERKLVTVFIRDLSEQKRSQRIQQLPSLIANTVHQCADLNEMFFRIQQIIGDILDTKNFFLALYDKASDTISLPYFVDEKDDFDRFPVGKTLTGLVIRKRKPLLVRKPDIEEMGRQGIIEFYGTVSKVWLGVPLEEKGEIRGALVVQSYTDENAFNENDLKFLQFISEHISLAIDHKQADDELQRSQEKFSSLFMSSPLSIVITRLADGTIEDVNQTAVNLTGKTREQLVGRPFMDLIMVENLRWKEISAFLEKNNSYSDLILKYKTAKQGERIGQFYGMRIGSGKDAYYVHLVNDITEKQKAEDELHRIHRIYRETIELAQGLPYRLNYETMEYDFVGDNSEELLCVPSDQLTYQRFSEMTQEFLVRNEDAPSSPVEFGRAFREGKIGWYCVDQRVILPNGEEKWFTDSAIPIVDPVNGKIVGSQGILQDITARKRIEAELRIREMEFRALVENTPDIIMRGDSEGRILYVNPVVEREVGLKVEEVVGKNLFDLDLALSDKEKARQCLSDVLTTKSEQMIEVSLKTRSGRRYYFVRAVPEFSSGGKISSVLAISRDITSIKRVEEALRESEERYRTLFNSGNDGIYVFKFNRDGSAGNFIEVNQTACQKLGYSREQFQKMGPMDIIVSDQTKLVLDSFEKLKTEKYILYEAEQVTKDGTKIPTEVNMHLIEMHGQQVALAIARDITERKQIERENQRSEKIESVGILAGGIAHDFNNILTAILGNITLAKMHADPRGKISAKLTEAEKACMRARDLTQQLLTFAKGGSPIKRAASITELMRESATFALAGSNVKPVFSIPDNIATVEIDEGQINQVINNLVINADQAMPEGGRVFISLENMDVKPDSRLPLKSGKYVRATIKDEGIGIPRNHLPKIFDPYFSTKTKGSGIGLTTVYSIIKNHGGLITVDSELGVGTQFSIYLPATAKEITREKDISTKDVKGRGRILIMDDEEAVREVAGYMLKMLGYKVDYAREGSEALQKYKAALETDKRFSAVIMDLTIPGGMGGKETIKELQKIDPKVKAIVSSGYSNDPVMANYKEYGFAAVVAKPFKIKQLGSALLDIM